MLVGWARKVEKGFTIIEGGICLHEAHTNTLIHDMVHGIAEAPSTSAVSCAVILRQRQHLVPPLGTPSHGG